MKMRWTWTMIGEIGKEEKMIEKEVTEGEKKTMDVMIEEMIIKEEIGITKIEEEAEVVIRIDNVIGITTNTDQVGGTLIDLETIITGIKI